MNTATSRPTSSDIYRGRLAPSPTGLLHLGHARTFWIAQERAHAANGQLLLRVEDLDQARCRPEYIAAMYEDLHWFGFRWTEGPDLGGPHAPYLQSERGEIYHAAFERLRAAGLVYPCTCSRQDVLRALSAPHAGEDEPIYPGTCRFRTAQAASTPRAGVSWRFRVPEGRIIGWTDLRMGPQTSVAGTDFGDFLIWRKDDLPSYQLAVAVDDAAMGITEVVRGADLITSTARQLLLYESLGAIPPAFYHCSLVTDERGARLAKRDRATSLRVLREAGRSPEELRESINPPLALG
ncbi:MAG: tRNA glutamyl-Q(34) synthetase GluQRS [Chthoniobacteraceae bacterium]